MSDTADYHPDPDQVDSLVDLEGAAAPPPTAAQLAAAAYVPVDVDDVIAALAQLVDLLDGFLVAGTGTPADRLTLLAELGDVLGRDGALPRARSVLAETVAADLDGPVQDRRGTWWKAGRSKRTTGWDKAAVRSAINRAAMAPIPIPDPETGELIDKLAPSAAEVIDRVWTYVDVAVGRTAKLREIGVTAEEYATVDWVDTVERIDPAVP